MAGGWRATPTTVSVADVIRAVDGPLVSVYGLRPEAVSYNESAEVLQHVWIAARSSLRDVFEQVTIRALADGKLPRAVTSRTQIRGRLAAALAAVRRRPASRLLILAEVEPASRQDRYAEAGS